MKKTARKPVTEPSRSANPSVVLDAFAPETELVLSVNGALLLEALDNPHFVGKRTPTLRDTIIAALVMIDDTAVSQAQRRGKLDDLIREFSSDHSMPEVLSLFPKVTAAIAAALTPLDSGADPDEKKSSAAAAGG